MSSHSIAEAEHKLSELIDRALKGEDVVITREGTASVALTPIAEPQPKVVTKADLDWLKARRARKISKEDAGASVSRMRDEDWL